MAKQKKNRLIISSLSGKPLKANEAMPADVILEPILKMIMKDYPSFPMDGYISLQELKKYRSKYLATLLSRQDHLNRTNQKIIKSIEDETFLSLPPEKIEGKLSFGERLADKIADFGGSWRFIIYFTLIIVGWMIINVRVQKSFDPFPFILLNLVLSCLAALQAPVIMMSQNRKEDKDRERAENDYMVNLKAELEIKQLNEKIDFLIQKHSTQEEEANMD